METKTLETKYTKLTYKYYDYKDLNIPNPILEVKRMKIINKLNKKYNINLGEIFMEGYVKNYNSEDPVLCSKILKKDIKDDNIRQNIIQELKDNIKKIKEICENTKHKKFYIKKRYNNIKNIVELYYQNNKILMKKHVYDRLVSGYINKSKYHVDLLIWCLYYRYDELGYLTGLFGSFKPEYYKILNNKYNMEVEGFGSFMNHTFKYYFGLFYDLEKYFGCLGNFFNGKFMKGFIGINPPFTTYLINKSIDKILQNLEEYNVSFLVILPVWSISERNYLNKVCKTHHLTNYKTDTNNKIFLKSKYLKEYRLYCKEDFKYYNFGLQRDINYTSTNIILVSSDNNESKNIKLDFIPNKFF